MTVIDEIGQEVSAFECDHGRLPARMWLTKRDKIEIGRLSGSEFSLAGKVAEVGVERAVPKLFGVPIAGWNAQHRDYQLTDPDGRGTAQSVRQRVDDWISRLHELFGRLEDWASEVSDARVKREDMTQQVEGPMTQFHVKARNVPTLTVFGGKNRIAFVPSALWITGANGRVNVTTNDQQYALVDLDGKDGRPSQWHLLLPSPKAQLVPLEKELFMKLLAERA